MVDDKTIEEIKEWLNSEEKDKYAGLQLLEKVSNHKKMVMRLQRKSNDKLVIEKVAWELMRYVPMEKEEEPEMWPPVIDRIKEEVKKLYEQRALVQKALVDLGDANDEETKAKAIELGDLANKLGVRHQELEEAKELFFKEKVIPNEEELFPEETNEDENEGDDPDTSGETSDQTKGDQKPKVIEITYKWAGDPAKAMQRKGNLISSLTKDRNKLKYQSDKKLDAENPMPEGDKRNEVLERIQNKEKEMAAIAEFLKPKDDANKAE